MDIASILSARSRVITGSVGALVIVLGLVALISRIEPPMRQGTGQFSNTLPTQETLPSFDIVRINQNGSAIFSGTATAGATVILTLNQEPFAEILADIRGDWIHTLGTDLEAGQHIIRISSRLAGFADSSSDEQLLIDLGGVDPTADTALPNNQAIVFAASSQRGLRVLQNHQLALDLSPDAMSMDAPIAVSEPTVVAVQDTTTAAVNKAPIKAVVKEVKISKVMLGKGYNSVTVRGSATPNAIIRAHVAGNPVEQTIVDASGRWEVNAEALGLNTALKKFTILQIRDGKELNRRVIALQPPASTTKQTASNTPVPTVKVRKGDSLWTLAKRVYKDGKMHTKILAANKDQIHSHKDLKPGMILKVPK